MRKIGSYFCLALISMNLLVGCAKPPTAELDKLIQSSSEMKAGRSRNEIEAQIQDIRSELKRQEGKLFKNYDNAKAMISKTDELIMNPSRIAVRSEDPQRTDANRFQISYFTGADQYSKDVVLILDTASGQEIFGIRGFGMIELNKR